MPAATPNPTPWPPRKAGLATCGLLALAINVAAVALAAEMPEPGSPSPAASTTHVRMIPVPGVEPVSATPATAGAARLDDPPAREATAHRATARRLASRDTSSVEHGPGLVGSTIVQTPASARARSDDGSAVAAAPPSEAAALPSLPPVAVSEPATAIETRFYRFEEVEVPAAPESDWNVDAVALDAAGISRLVVDLRVDAQGNIVDCRILEPALADAVRAPIEEALRQTAVKPAMRFGRPVASERRIEMGVS